MNTTKIITYNNEPDDGPLKYSGGVRCARDVFLAAVFHMGNSPFVVLCGFLYVCSLCVFPL